MSTTTCTCDTPHVERVHLSPLHILGPGTYWLAARPGETYLAGHGFHFYRQEEAERYAFEGVETAPGTRLTDAELAADYWFQHSIYVRQAANLLTARPEHLDAAAKAFQRETERSETLWRFARLPHYDEAVAR